jgi:hypothetical protein
VEYGEKIPKCPNCGSDDIKVHYYEEVTVRRLITRLAEMEARLKLLEDTVEQELDQTEH